MDYLSPWNVENTHWSMNRGSCSCCASQYTTDPDHQSTYTRPIDQKQLDTWEKWLLGQLDNVYLCRQARVPSPMLSTYHPTMEVAWDVAIIKARILGEQWRGKKLPGYAHGNPIQAALGCILDDFEVWRTVHHLLHEEWNREESQDILD